MKRNKTLKRERVNRALELIFDYPLTIVEAPIGYGKTTAVREFLAARGVPVIWTSFFSEDDTPEAFWDRLATEIGILDETAGIRLKSLGIPFNAPQAATIISIMSELDYSPDTTLVIDDFHLAKSMRVTGLFRRFVSEMPGDFHIVFITRDMSNLDIAELFAKGRCNILPQQTLRFTVEEIRAYCALMGFRPGEDGLKRVTEYTGGWISLAYLIFRGMEQGIPVGRNSVIDELVEKVLYDAYDEPIQRFLMHLSVMDAFTAEQARYVTEEIRAGEFLKKLRRENAFVSFDEAAGVYKFHNVLLDFLRARQIDSAESAIPYRRVGEWFLEHKTYKTAYRYLFRAGETERVLALLNDEDAITHDSAEFEGAMEMFAAVPRTLLFKYPLAYLQFITLLILSGDPAAVRDGVSRLDELQGVYERFENIQTIRKNHVLAEISTVRVFTVFNDVHQMVACANEALHLQEGGVSCLMKREAEFTFGSPHFLYTYYREPGRLRETADFMVSEFPAFSRLASGCGTGCDYVTLAEYALETGDWQAAELNAFKAIYKAKTMKQTGIALCAGLTLTRLYIYKGKIDEALEHLRQLRADVTKDISTGYNTSLELAEGYAYACLAQPDSIPEWLRTGDMSPARFMYHGMAFNYVVHGKAVLLSKDYIRLEMLTEECAAHFSIFHNQLGFLHNQILDAAAKYRLYGREKGCAALREALGMAREDHILLPFAEYAPAILDMLRHIAQNDSRDDYIKEVLFACEQYLESLKRTPQSAASLTARELEVLTLTAEGLKRSEIACRLGVSAGTVKTHLENIYRKLETGGKMEAVRKAQKLKLF
ncbi:MAG: LuxR C-terminal-related transcriptional regulator [Syntrophomonadaceae bacterium]|nr:LuxR C-terminal-related transcriptional regulator [Syntrophomonadaceae bacterium]